MCIMLFLVVMIFGILAPELKDRDYSQTSSEATIERTTSTTEEPLATAVEVIEEQSTETTTVEVTEEQTIPATTEATEEKLEDKGSYVLSEEAELYIDKLIEEMTIEEKVGQLFFIKDDGRFDYNILQDYPVGGIIMFKGDFNGKSSDAVKSYINDFQDASNIPLLIGVDEEGGTVVRLSCYPALADYQFRSSRDLYYAGGYELIEQDTIEKSELLSSYGINVNFAPVCDVSIDTGDFIYSRAFGDNVEETCEYVSLMVETMNESGMGSVLKHFPGYGNNGDTHKAIITDTRDYQEYVQVDFKPFKSGIESGAWCILMNHIIVDSMDEEMPASLSEKVHTILREKLEFGGVIITDDLMMGGVSNLFSKEEVAVLALKAGNDMILSTDYDVQYKAVLEAVESGEISEDRLDESIRRILRWKITLGLINVY